MAPAAKATFRCERCGSTSYSMGDEDAVAVCVECGLESSNHINTTFDDWAEEQQTYGKLGQRGGVKRRRERTARKKGAAKRAPATLAQRLAGHGCVVRAIARALVQRCGVDQALVKAVDDIWRKYEAALHAGKVLTFAVAPRAAPSQHPEAVRWRAWKANAKKKKAAEELAAAAVDGAAEDDGATGAEDDDDDDAADEAMEQGEEVLDLCKSHELHHLLGCVFYAARQSGVALGAVELARAAWHGAVPYLDCWMRCLDDEARRELEGSRMEFTTPRVPLASSIALVAELVFLRVDGHGDGFTASNANQLLARLAAALGVDDQVAAEADRLRVRCEPDVWSETRLVALLAVAAARAGKYDLEPTNLRPRFPWSAEETEVLPEARDMDAYLHFVEGVLYEPVVPMTNMCRAGFEFANVLKAATMNAAPPPPPPPSRTAFATQKSLVSAAALFAECPLAIFEKEVDALRAKLDCNITELLQGLGPPPPQTADSAPSESELESESEYESSSSSSASSASSLSSSDEAFFAAKAKAATKAGARKAVEEADSEADSEAGSVEY